MRYLIALALTIACTLTGCAGLAPSLTPSTVTTEFNETVTPEGGMSTTYNVTSKGNVDLAAHAYDGTYDATNGVTHVTVGQNSEGVDSTAQIAATAQAIGSLLSTIQSIAPLALPVPSTTPTEAIVAPNLSAVIRATVEETLRNRLTQ